MAERTRSGGGDAARPRGLAPLAVALPAALGAAGAVLVSGANPAAAAVAYCAAAIAALVLAESLLPRPVRDRIGASDRGSRDHG
jgi:hypothetical protein